MKNTINKKQLRDFGFLIGIGLPLIFGFLIPFLYGHSFRVWTIWISSPLLILSIINPSLLFFPYKFWMKLGEILGWINIRLILGLVFFIILLPISIFMRFFKYDPLRKKDLSLKTYREIKKEVVIDLTKIF